MENVTDSNQEVVIDVKNIREEGVYEDYLYYKSLEYTIFCFITTVFAITVILVFIVASLL